MSEEDAKEYIRENAWDMSPSEESDVYGSLGEELMESDVSHDKITDEETSIIFDGE